MQARDIMTREVVTVTPEDSAKFAAGVLAETFGWAGLNLAALPLLLIAAGAILLAGNLKSATAN